MKIKSPAKINLTLDVLTKNPNGYHEIETLMQEISLCDMLTVEKGEKGIELTCSDKEIPVDSTNLVHKAYNAICVELEKKTGPSVDSGYDMPDEAVFGGVKVHIDKKIPAGAGLGGGSSNAAAFIRAYSEIYELGWSDKKMAEIGAIVGMDVPFFIYGGTALGSHYGEELEVLGKGVKLDVVVIFPGFKSNTKKMYELLDMNECGLNVDKSRGILADLMKGDGNIFGYVGNDFETLIDNKKWGHGARIEEMKVDLIKNGAQAAAMTGSGSAVFGLFDDGFKAEMCAMRIEKKYPFVWCGKTAR